MKISILTVGGSPQLISEKTIFGDGVQLGVGGAELTILTLCKAWTEAGHDVTLYNNPREVGASCFKQANEKDFDPDEDRDILLYFRGPNPRGLKAKGKKIWFSTDQYTIGSYTDLAKEVDKIVTISSFHAEYFKKQYGIENTTVIDIPVRDWEYTDVVEKDPMQVLFCSVPERGLMELVPIWKLITDEVPEAQLYITSDHRLWDASVPVNSTMKYRMAFAEFESVHYLSVVNRKDLIDLQMRSSIHLYPNQYSELFCIACAECQYAGAYPITSGVGALATTNMGFIAQHHPATPEGQHEMASAVVNYLKHPAVLQYMSGYIKELAHNRFSVETALESWDEVLFD